MSRGLRRPEAGDLARAYLVSVAAHRVALIADALRHVEERLRVLRELQRRSDTEASRADVPGNARLGAGGHEEAHRYEGAEAEGKSVLEGTREDCHEGSDESPAASP